MGGKARYRAFIADGMKDGHKEEYYDVEDQRFLGAEVFGERLQDQHEVPRAKKRRPLDKVVREFADEVGIAASELKSADRSWAVSKTRTKIAYVLVRRQGYTLSEVAKYEGEKGSPRSLHRVMIRWIESRISPITTGMDPMSSAT